MKLQNFEKGIQRKFEDFQPSVDDNKIWLNIEDQLPKEKKDRKFFLWIWMGLGLVMIGSGAFFFSNDWDSLNQSVKMEEPLNERLLVEEPQDSYNQMQGKENATEVEDIEAVNVNQSINEPVISKTVSDHDSNFESRTIAQNHAVGLTMKNVVNQTIGIEKMDLESTSFLLQSEVAEVEREIDRSIGSMLVLPRIQLEIEFDFPKMTRVEVEEWKDMIPSSKVQFTNSKTSDLTIQLGLFKPMIKYSGLDAELIELRKQSEEAYEMLQASILYRRMMTGRLSLVSGIRFWTSQRRSLHVLCEEDMIEGAFNSIQRMTKTTVARYGADKNISIPVLIDLEFIRTSKINLGLQTGYEFSVWGSHSGFEINTDATEYDISEDNDGRYIDRGGDYLSLATRLNYSLNNRFGLMMNIEYKLGLGNIARQQLLVNKSYDFLGFNLGFHYNIN